MAANAKDDVDDLKRQLEVVRNDMRILAEMARGTAGRRAMEVREDAEAKLDDLSDEARLMLMGLRGEGGRLYGEAEAGIRRNPIAAIGIALGIGWLVGTVMRR